MAVPNCDTGPQPSRIPGNIGIIKSKVMVWQHDPFWSRPNQILSWPFSSSSSDQMQETISNVKFELGGAILKSTFKCHDMFVCTQNPNKGTEQISSPAPGETTNDGTVDFVGSLESGVGQIAQSRMPNGTIYKCNGGIGSDTGISTDLSSCAVQVNGKTVFASDPSTGKDIFPHQVWKHTGSLLSDRVLIHPSEYQFPLSDLQAIKNIGTVGTDFISLEQLQAAAKWDYIEVADNGKLSIWPIMITKQSPDLQNSVHWTLEKWTPLWQGEDFFITVKMGDKRTDDTRDPNDGSNITMSKKYTPYLDYSLLTRNGNNVPGITNEAFYIKPQPQPLGSGASEEELKQAAIRTARAEYDWRYKTYILIEIGSNDPLHNYFIELVKGRNPRFLHLGEEWDNPTRLEQGANAANASFIPMKKCRQIGEPYAHVKCDQLFRQKDFRINVRNHLGRLVITFEGYEGNPWVISRLDNDPRLANGTKKLIPMVVPSAPVKIHGGNISCAVNFTPTEYVHSATIPFVNRQVDTGPNNDSRATNNDVYLTFSHVGNAVQYTNPSVQRRYFSDPRFLYAKVGYDCDAYLVSEQIRNITTPIKIYEEYHKQYRLHGKGWYNRVPRDTSGQVQLDPNTQAPLPPQQVNGMSESEGGIPSELSIINARNPSKEFPLSLEEESDGHYEWKDYVARWDVGIELQAGSVNLLPPSGENSLPVEDTFNAKLFENYVTPIATSWRLIVLGGGKSFEGSVEPFDISPLVSHISDSWSDEDFHSLSHEMQLKCYIPIESTTDTIPDTQDEELGNLFALGKQLLPLHDRAFYVTVSYWWENGIGYRYVRSNELNYPGQDPSTNDVLIQMTGVAYGAQIERSNNRLIMSFTIKDYMSVLENQFIFNSPFFDAVQDVQAVYELAKLAGFADESELPFGIDRRPLGYLRKVMSDGDRNGERVFYYNGEKTRCERYDLPGSYSSLAEPSVKFQNGETYENAVKRVAQLAGKTIYFDRWGVLRLETPAALVAAFASANEEILFESVFDFVTTPISRERSIPNQEDPENFIFDPLEHAAHLVYNTLTYQRSVEECANQIIVMSASNDIRLADGSRTGGFIIEGYTFFDQLWNPASEGFIGYRKPLYQQEGAFGSIEGVRNAISVYAKKKFPPVIMSFETYSVPGLKALDIITLDNNLAYITEISHDIDPSTNRAWCSITCFWLKNYKGNIGFLDALEPVTEPAPP